MLGRFANTGIKQHLQAACLRSFARARGAHRRETSLDRPIFIVGCGRSGTTILGRSLGQHEAVGYLNEPRLLWQAAFPRTDISSRFARRVDGSLVLDQDDWTPANARLLRFLFARELQRNGKTRLCEKTPGNEFRLALMTRVFPDARYLWIVREGDHVARSIKKLADGARGHFGWYGFKDYKWRQLEKVCRASAGHRELPSLCCNNFDRGLLEWRMSIHVAADFFRRHPESPMLRIRYEDLTGDPIGTLRSVSAFAELPYSPRLLRWVGDNIRTSQAAPYPPESQPVSGFDALGLAKI
jgi:Sulfotransferase family